MINFKDYIGENETNGVDLTVISVDFMEIDKINEELELCLKESSTNPYKNWINSQNTLSKFGINLPKTIFQDIDEGEKIVVLNCEDTDYYFYYCFSLNEENVYETFATITDETGLEELLEEE